MCMQNVLPSSVTEYRLKVRCGAAPQHERRGRPDGPAPCLRRRGGTPSQAAMAAESGPPRGLGGSAVGLDTAATLEDSPHS